MEIKLDTKRDSFNTIKESLLSLTTKKDNLDPQDIHSTKELTSSLLKAINLNKEISATPEDNRAEQQVIEVNNEYVLHLRVKTKKELLESIFNQYSNADIALSRKDLYITVEDFINYFEAQFEKINQ